MSQAERPKVVGIIPARYASTRFPGKPLKLLVDKPMIQWTYERACQAKLISDVYVATDDERIYQAVESFGGKVVMTGECANGSERCWEAYQQLNNDYDLVVNIQGDEPLVDPEHIDKLIQVLWDARSDGVQMGATAAPINNNDELELRATTKVVMDVKSNALYFSRAVIPHSKAGTQSQTSTVYYRNCGMYAFVPEFLKQYAIEPAHPLQMEEDLEQLKALEMGQRIRMAVVDQAEGGIDLPEQLAELNKRLSN